MPYVNLDQSNFTNGVLDPRAYARTDFEKYYRSLKQALNALIIPQGGVQRRWGTKYVDTLNAALNPIAHPEFTEINTLTIDDSCIYLLVWEAGFVLIYLENILVATVATPYLAEDIQNLRWAQVQDRLIVANLNFNPYQLVRSANAPDAITAFSNPNSTLTLNVAITANQVLPVTFTTSGALPTTLPQIYAGRTYYINSLTTTTIQIFSDPVDAANLTNAYAITALGNNSNVVIQNTWAFTAITFIAIPAYDFNGGYSALTFTPSATSGNVTLTASGNIFSAAFIGGLYTGNGGIMRITGFTNATTVTGFTIQAFTNTNAIMGSFSFLGEPAWSAARGYPTTVSFYQNRLVFAGSPSIQNGVWLSAVNVAFNFDDSETLADDAISWYPASGQTNYVRALTSGKTLTVHTNTGNYFTPFANEIPLTPTNFVLIEQNKDGVSTLQPVFIDNQIIYVDKSGNNVKNMTWDIAKSSYVLNNISIASSSLIVQPVDMTAFTDPNFTDGYYVLFVNGDGTLAIFQTLNEQNIAAWTNGNATVTYDNLTFTQTAGYQHVTSSINRVWFICQRTKYVASAPVAITAFNAVNNTLQANGHGIPIGAASQVAFTTAGALPTTVPQINITQYFWVNATDANNFAVYGNASDAAAQVNLYTIVNAGNNSNVLYQTPTPYQAIEELDFLSQSDETIKQLSVNSATVNNLGPLNGNYVSVVADGAALAAVQVFNNSVTLPQIVQNVNIGIPYITTIQLLPVANIPGTPSNLYKTKHYRGLYLNCYQTLGATIQGFPIIIPTKIPQQLGQPVTGVYEYGIMEDWDYTQFDITIQQVNPLPLTLLGVSYIVELT
jgi:hypothetical protein